MAMPVPMVTMGRHEFAQTRFDVHLEAGKALRDAQPLEIMTNKLGSPDSGLFFFGIPGSDERKAA
jgi:hypothetical protein